MKETKFTPGPWSVSNLTDVFTDLGAKNAHGVAADESDGWQIADTSVGKTYVNGQLVDLEFEEQKANARLIAAAPELYEALEVARNGIAWYIENTMHATECDYEALENIDAALAKARGDI